MTTYAARLAERVGRLGALCAGIDPSRDVIERWGLPYDCHGLETVARTMVDALADVVAVFKPQSAFFEAHGSAGVRVLEQTMAAARAAGALVLLDVKRGDIGSTMAAYAAAYLGEGPLAADAVTVSPYLGLMSLAPAFDAAHATGRGVYVLARTSNPEGSQVQLSVGLDGRPVVQTIVDDVAAINDATGQFGIGLVVGATHSDLGCDLSDFNASILAPGIGAQGGSMDAIAEIFGTAAGHVLPSASREILQAGPTADGLRASVAKLLDTSRN